jgi:myo-inositol 2-dehydrogenase / D-chiro-inositol 1-dehydrogenase
MARAKATEIGLAIIGGGRIGAFRGAIAGLHPQVGWIGIAEIRPERARVVGEQIGADFVTEDFHELLARPEVNAVIVCTDEHLHAEPVLAALERNVPMLIEKPLAMDVDESARILAGIERDGIDAVIGYTQRFRQRFVTAKDRIGRGALGDPSLLTARGFLNRMVSTDMYSDAEPGTVTPMVLAGTHMVDLAMWLLEGKVAKSVYSRSSDKLYGPKYGGVDQTVSILEFDDGTIANIVFNWTLPVSWPCSVYSLELAVVGTEGVLTIDDTHRDVVMAVSSPQLEGYAPRGERLVDFLGSYLPGDVALGELRGPMREETTSWLNRISTGHPGHHASAADGHDRLLITRAMDLSAATGRAISLPLDPDELRAGATASALAAG